VITVTTERTISAAHHNGPPDGKCYTNHGHEWKVTAAFSGTEDELDEYGWLVDFRLIKQVIDRYDHRDFNTELNVPPSAENLAIVLAAELEAATGRQPDYITVEEGSGNMITWQPHEEDPEDPDDDE
jgi:6-pyruvoyl-tetrahydropterin synthase